MIEVKKDWHLLVKATECRRDFVPIDDLITWYINPDNIMLIENQNVGIATMEYPGVYNVHWYFKDRGRKAIDLGKAMVTKLFEECGAECLRGLIRLDLKASRWACRQVGLKSKGIIEDYEVFFANKQEFLEGNI